MTKTTHTHITTAIGRLALARELITKSNDDTRIEDWDARKSDLHRGLSCLNDAERSLVQHMQEEPPVPMVLFCPSCSARHIDEGEFATKQHHTHACQSCGMVWRPAIVPTVGVQFLPGFKNIAPGGVIHA